MKAIGEMAGWPTNCRPRIPSSSLKDILDMSIENGRGGKYQVVFFKMGNSLYLLKEGFSIYS